MELRHIRYFVAVAEECHFGRAAERLHMAQPPLSQQIRQLEAEVGVTLLTRSTRKVELTTAGERYLEWARAILAAVDAAGDEAHRVAAGEIGRVAIGFTGSATYELLPPFSRVLRLDFPLLELDLKGEMLTPDQVVALEDRTLDLGFLRPPVRHPDLDVLVLRREPLIAVLPQTHDLAGKQAVRLSELRRRTVHHLPQPGGIRSRVRRLPAGVVPAAGGAGGGGDIDPGVLRRGRAGGCPGARLGTAPADHRSGVPPLAGTTEEVELAVATRAGEASPDVARVLGRAQALLGGGRPVHRPMRGRSTTPYSSR